MQMYAFFVVRGHTLNELMSLTTTEKILMHHAANKYYEELSVISKAIGG